jgi:hypothetical protein
MLRPFILPLFTEVCGMSVLRSPHPASCMDRPSEPPGGRLRASVPRSPDRVVVVDGYAAGEIKEAGEYLRNEPHRHARGALLRYGYFVVLGDYVIITVFMVH